MTSHGSSQSRLPSVQTVARHFTRQLRSMRDPKRAEGMQAYFRHAIVGLGIPTPVLRRWVAEQVKPLRKSWGAAEAIDLCSRLFDETEMEIRAAGFLALKAFRSQLTPALLPQATRWLEQRLDNWALVDGFCGDVLSPLLAKHPEVERQLAAWSRNAVLWVRRAALVTLVPSARRGQRLDRVYELASRHFADPEDLMHKATGWLLREAGRTDRERLHRFLLHHGPHIPRTTLRYAIEHFSAEQRAVLLQITRGKLAERTRTDHSPPAPWTRSPDNLR